MAGRGNKTLNRHTLIAQPNRPQRESTILEGVIYFSSYDLDLQLRLPCNGTYKIKVPRLEVYLSVYIQLEVIDVDHGSVSISPLINMELSGKGSCLLWGGSTIEIVIISAVDASVLYYNQSLS